LENVLATHPFSPFLQWYAGACPRRIEGSSKARQNRGGAQAADSFQVHPDCPAIGLDFLVERFLRLGVDENRSGTVQTYFRGLFLQLRIELFFAEYFIVAH
jgi:hypothetical protein